MKKVMALVISAILLISMGTQVMAFESFGNEVTTNLPTYTTLQYDNTNDMVLQNDKYIFWAATYVASNYPKYLYNSALNIFDKATGERLKVYRLPSTTAAAGCLITDMWVDSNTLYVTWGNAANNGNMLAENNEQASKTYAYDVTNVTKDSGFTTDIATSNAKSGTVIDHGHIRTTPFGKGNVSYLDKKTGKLYVKGNRSTSSNYSEYRVYSTSDNSQITKYYFNATDDAATGSASQSTVQIAVSDGWLLEVIQNKAGLGFVTTNTLSTNNQIRVYNLNEASASTGDYDNTVLRGKYITATTGDTAINDIEVVGDYMYLATTAGIEVVSLAPAKAAGVTQETAATLTAAATIKEANYGGALDLEVKDGFLYAALDKGTADGAVAVYNIKSNPASPALIASKAVAGVGAKDISVDEDTIYILKKGSLGMTAFNYTAATPVVTNIDAVTFNGAATVATGTGDVKVNLTTDKTGRIICAVYEGTKLSDVLIAPYSSGSEITVAEDYTVGEKVTKISAMFWSDINNQLVPLCPSKDISK